MTRTFASAAVVLAAAATLTACGSAASTHPAASSPKPTAAATTTRAAADPCTAEVSWRDSGGLASLVKIEHGMGRMANDETAARIPAIQGDGTRLYSAAVSAASDPPPIDRGKWLHALRLAERATVDAQAGDYQASTTAITETADLFSVMISDLKAKCG